MNAKQAKALAEYFPEYETCWISSRPPARKGYAGTMALYKKGLSVEADYPAIGVPGTMDLEGRLITLELDPDVTIVMSLYVSSVLYQLIALGP